MTKKKPERVAWLVMFGAFVAFLVLCASVPVGVRYYLLHATTTTTAVLEVIDGTPTISLPGAVAPIAVSRGTVTTTVPLTEGSTLETDENSRGIITFGDGSTVILFPSTQITLREMHVSTFPWGVEPITLVIDEARGRIRIGAASLISPNGDAARRRDLQIHTQQLTAELSEGSYAVEVTGDSSQVIVTDGSAAVTAQDATVNVGRRQRTVVPAGQPPLAALPAAQDILINGDFSDPLPRGWDVVRDPVSVPGSVAVEAMSDRSALHIVRTGSNQNSAIAGVLQQIDTEVSDYHTVQLLADVRVHYQNLSGGGVPSSEYPLILRIRYRDVYGIEAEWVHGFYIQNSTNNPTNNGEEIPPDVWVPFESSNLYETLDPKPFFITSVQIYASGWDYDSYVSGVRLVVE